MLESQHSESSLLDVASGKSEVSKSSFRFSGGGKKVASAFLQKVYCWGSIMENKSWPHSLAAPLNSVGRAPELCGWALWHGSVSSSCPCRGRAPVLCGTALCPGRLVLLLCSSVSAQRALGERALERLLLGRAPGAPGALGESAYLRACAPARSVDVLAARSGRALQVFGGHVTDALWTWNALLSSLATALSLIRVQVLQRLGARPSFKD